MPPPAASVGPSCGLCGASAIVHWQRRLTDAEFAAHLEWETGRRERALALTDPQAPPPDFGPLPLPQGCTTTVFACAAHAIALDAAAQIHAKDCTAPSTSDLPGCNCTPEPPQPDPEPDTPDGSVVLPPGWTTRG
ncbi:hypothetical protein [Streptomyces triculaminicus]|uniref:hypothetical protein n=1 Tax=Streptomyces triculaminicus TaxID=2816232 RepID=UPI0037ACF3D4